MDVATDLLSLLLFATGTATLVMSKKRRHERTNKSGVERFPSFWARLRGRSMDHLLAGLSVIFLAVGTLTLAWNHFDSWGWVVVAPVCVLLLYLLLGT